MLFRRWVNRAIWWLSTRVFGSSHYKARRGLHRGLNIVGGLGFVPSQALSAEEQYLAGLDLTGKVVYDVGAYIGLRTLFFATRAKQVFSYEPNSHNRNRLLRNLRANPALSNVVVRPVGVGEAPGSFTVLWNEQRPGECVAEGSPVARMLVDRGVPMTKETVPVVALDDEARNQPAPDFIKIDVEGLELEVLRGAERTLRERHPELFIELHGSTLENKLQNARDVLDLLFRCGYAVYDVEQQGGITPGQRYTKAPSHIHCRLQTNEALRGMAV